MTDVDAVEVVEEFVDELPNQSPALVIGAFLVGAGIGGGLAFIFTRRKLEAKYAKISDDEIAEMREHYQAKGRSLEAQHGKGDLEKLVKERGYTTPEPEVRTAPPMAVQPPKSVVDTEATTPDKLPDDAEMAVNDVEGTDGVKVRNVFEDNREQVVPHQWDQHTELRRRTPDRPYVVHYDERHDMEGYSDVSYTYYAADDVLCNEKDEVIDPAMRDDLVGEANLDRFGHGSNDPMIVFIRNDNLEILYEIIKSPNSFAQEVHGFDPPEVRHDSDIRGNLERMRRRERDAES